MLEKNLEKRCCEYVKSRGGMAIKLNPAGYRGIPDRLVLMSGTVVFVEFKRPGSRPRANQVHFINRLTSLGLRAGWIDSFDRFLELIGED